MTGDVEPTSGDCSGSDGGGDDGDAGAGPPPFPSLGGLSLPDLGPLGGALPLGGLSSLFDRAREQLEEASAQAEDAVVTGRAGGGAVEVDMSGNLEVLAVRISRDVVDPGDVAMLEDLVLAAVRQAVAEASAVRERAASSLFPEGVDFGEMVQGLFSGGLPPGMPEAFNSFMDDLLSGDGPVLDFEELSGGEDLDDDGGDPATEDGTDAH
ncbi:MAG TPA: YbaB/EbfC family nucleoid-associated protein [Acidimicrobiales bacterium]|nr:YbaB/EbfC family nucleoid-associated protein [Acidimicrobiales bacterium]